MGQTPLPKGEAWALPEVSTHAERLAHLAHARALNILQVTNPRIKPRLLKLEDQMGVEWATDSFELVTEARSLVCHQAVLVALTASPLTVLGIEPIAPPKNATTLSGVTFHELNIALQISTGLGSAVQIRRPSERLSNVLDVFRRPYGGFVIYCLHYHESDIENHLMSEGIGHYIYYNAGTRMLQTYPEVLVLEQADVDNPSLVAKKLRKRPYLLRLSDARSFTTVRQVFCCLRSPHLLSLPHSNPTQIQKYLGMHG